jgi:hypothetical protein
MTNNITDRACLMMEAIFKCVYTLNGNDLTDRQIKTRINATMKKHILRCFGKQDAVPLMLVTELTNTNPLVIEDSRFPVTEVTLDCKMAFCIEDCENHPESVGREFVGMFIDMIPVSKQEHCMSVKIKDYIQIENPLKGYIQADNTIFIQIP